MKAIVLRKHGDPEVLRYEDFPDPIPAPHEIVVQVRACGINRRDIWTRIGGPGRKVGLPCILGADIAGEVYQVGSLVQGIQVGDPVFLNPGASCGQCVYCQAGKDNLCPEYVIIGGGAPWHGGYAEFIKVPGANAVPLPKGLSYEHAAAFPLVFLTAWHMLMTRVRLQAGDEILVTAAGSGVGSAAIQIGKLCGARVIALAGTDEKVAQAKHLGADEAINYITHPEFSREVRRLTDKRGVDVVFESVGAAIWEQCMKSLTKEGRLVTCGVTSGAEVTQNVRDLFWQHQSILGSTMGTKGELHQIAKLMGQGKLHPVIDHVYPLRDAAQAHRQLEARRHFGKLVLVPSDRG